MGFYSIVDHRADNSLFLVSSEFKTFSAIKERQYNKVRLAYNKVDELYTSHKIINKWMGRVYIFKINAVVQAQFTQDMVIKLTYKREKGSNQPKFISRYSSDLLDQLNANKAILNICREIDFEKLELKFNAEERKWEIEIWPNYGDFIWMLIPPLRYMRKPNNEEVANTFKMISHLTDVLKKSTK